MLLLYDKMKMYFCVQTCSSTVHGLQSRVDSLEKSNSKLIEEVSATCKISAYDFEAEASP